MRGACTSDRFEHMTFAAPVGRHFIVCIPFNNRGRQGEVMVCYRDSHDADRLAARMNGAECIVTNERLGCPVCEKFPRLP